MDGSAGMASPPTRPISPDDSLPPVEPPSAAFLVQLFLVPGLIVAIIVFVWLAFHWLAHLGNDPQAYVRTLRRNNEGRWQAALNLANDLRGPGAQSLKNDEALAVELGRILEDEALSGRTGEQSQTLKLYLCRALGEFAVPAAAAPLLRQVAREGDPATARAAVEALAVLNTNLIATGHELEDQPAVVRVVAAAAAATPDATLRSACGFTLGVLGGEEAVRRLLELKNDDDEDVRYNAALGLARLGRQEAVDTLGEMLALPDVDVPGDDDGAAQSQRYKRALVVVNALRGVALLVDASHALPPGEVRGMIERLETDAVPEVQSSAAALRLKLDRM